MQIINSYPTIKTHLAIIASNCLEFLTHQTAFTVLVIYITDCWPVQTLWQLYHNTVLTYSAIRPLSESFILESWNWKYTVEKVGLLQPYFGYLSCMLVVFVIIEGMLIRNVLEKLLLFVKLVYPFRRPINQHFWWDLVFLWSYTSALVWMSSLVAWKWQECSQYYRPSARKP